MGLCSSPAERGRGSPSLVWRTSFSSLITDWRRQHRQGLLKAAVGRADGGRGGPYLFGDHEAASRERTAAVKLAQAEAVIDVQGKVHALLEEISKSAATEES